jgi:ABC-type uncharacterized transport system substrate-binding protein
MRRRQFIAGLGGAAAWPLAAHAQQRQRMKRIAVLMGMEETAPDAVGLKAVLDRLKTLGWAEGVTAHVDIRWSKNDPGLTRENAQALLALSPDVILCQGNPALAQLRPLAGRTPIVFVMVVDPVGTGFVTDLARPGGNITGFAHFEPAMGGKWVEMLKEIAPDTGHVGVLMHPETYAHLVFWREARAAARTLGIEPYAAGIHTAGEVEREISMIAVHPTIRSPSFTAISSSLWRRDGCCRRYIPSAPIRWQARSPPTGWVLLISIDQRRITSTAS